MKTSRNLRPSIRPTVVRDQEEMRILQQKISEQSSARSSPSAGDESSFGVRGSIAEQVAHTMYGSEGIGGLSVQDMVEEGTEADAALAAIGKGVRRGVTSGVSTGDVPRPAMAAPFHAGTEVGKDGWTVIDSTGRRIGRSFVLCSALTVSRRSLCIARIRAVLPEVIPR